MTHVIQGVSSFKIADLKLKIAALTLTEGMLDALFTEMKSLEDAGISSLLKELLATGEKEQQRWNDLVQAVSDFIHSITQKMSQFYAKAG